MRPSQRSSIPPPPPPVDIMLEGGAAIGLPENPPTQLARSMLNRVMRPFQRLLEKSLTPVEMLEVGAAVELPDDPPTQLADESTITLRRIMISQCDDDVKVVEDFVSMWVSHLDNLENYYESSKNGSIVKNCVQSMKNGLEFLRKLYLLTLNGNLPARMMALAVPVYVRRDSLTICGEENQDLQRVVMNLANIVTEGISPAVYLCLFAQTNSRDNYGRIIDLIMENISVIKSSNAIVDRQTVTLEKMVGELRLELTRYKPLCVCFAPSPQLLQMNTSLDSVLNDAAVVIYLLFIGKMDKKTAVKRLHMVICDGKKIRLSIYNRFLQARYPERTYHSKGWFFILDNLIHILAKNSDSLNEPNKHLYEELKELRTVVGESERLYHYLGLTESTESICYEAMPIVSSIYVEEDVHKKQDHILNSVVQQIKLIKLQCDSQVIKLYDYPKVDGMGFLKFFLGNLKESLQHNKMSVIWSKIETLYIDIQCLVSSLKTSDEKLPTGELWTRIVRLAYEAEHVIDLYLVIPDARCVSTLSNIVEEVKEKKEEVLALADKRFHAKNVALTTSSPTHDIPLHVDNVLVGFQEDIVVIRKDLLTGESDLQVISIVGMAGAGKTSLAKHLFKECSHDGHFDKKAWCTASQTYQMKDLLHTLLAQINPSENKDMDDQMLADTLCRSLKGRKYLVVIDDVWDVSIWNYLHRYFADEKRGSRILITTRDYNVSPETRSKVHHLRPLTKDESWELLQKKLTKKESGESLPKYIESIAKEVAMSCKGLPLSIVIIGSLLHHAATNEEVWNQIAKDVTSTILSDPEGKCKVILELSYNHLTDNLKACFLYLGIFPEDREISVSRLVKLWIAEGFVRGMIAADVNMEDVGKRYVNDLMKRNLVIPITEKREGGVESFQLHDLLRDFCLKKAEEEHFFTVLDNRDTFHSSHHPRRMSINCDMEKNLHPFSWNNVRTVISFGNSSDIKRIIKSGRMLLLNVLDVPYLSESAARRLYHCVHLRYLAVWSLDFYGSFFGTSISKLLNLQVLILHFNNNERIKVPDLIWDLVKLRHIDIHPSFLFSCRDSKKAKDSTVLLENLESLSRVQLVYEDENWLRKLPKLENLSCQLLGSFEHSCQQYQIPKLDLCNRLTSLKVESYIYDEDWMGCKLHLPASLTKLCLVNFELDSDDISEIGKSLPNLEELELYYSMQSWSTIDEDFPKLKILQITDARFREWDVSEDSFPNLEQLWLKRCLSLQEIPYIFADNLNLRLLSVRYCNPSLYKSARQIEKIQLEALNTELKLDLVE